MFKVAKAGSVGQMGQQGKLDPVDPVDLVDPVDPVGQESFYKVLLHPPLVTYFLETAVFRSVD